jgi:D-alanyl-D-alanine carboxypeptidase
MADTEHEPVSSLAADDARAVSPAAAGEAVPALAPSPVSRRTLAIAGALSAIVAVIVLDVVFIVSGVKKHGPALPVRAAPTEPAPQGAPALIGGVSSAQRVLVDAPPPKFDPPPVEALPEPTHAEHSAPGTVQEAANRSCTTSSVDGLSRQIIRQSRCIDPGAFVAVPSRPNLVKKSDVYLYLEAPARDHLLKALDAHRKLTMTVNSSLRTVAQQYLLWRWYSNKRCGIHLATPPGDSNHETGLALDIAEAPAWRAPLKAEDFHWLGAIDAMHFDYKGPNAVSHASIDVKAFQQLWNFNHSNDRIADSGRFTPETEERLKKSPAAGFPHAPHCQ